MKHKKSKQTRLKRFLDTYLPLDGVMLSWTMLALQKAHKGETHRMMVLVDEVDLEVDLIDVHKALVSAVPFRKRAIPIVFKPRID